MGLISDIHYIKSFAVYIVVVLSVMFYGRLTRPSQYPIAWTRWIFMFLTLAFWSAASQTVVSLLATCILAARAPYMELSSLVVTLCDHQQKLRQHWHLKRDFLLGGYVGYDFIKCSHFSGVPVRPCGDNCCCIALEVGFSFIFLSTNWSCMNDDKPLAVRISLVNIWINQLNILHRNDCIVVCF